MVRLSGKIRRILIDAGLVGEEDWNAARSDGRQPVATLLDQGLLSEDSLFETLGRAAGVPPVDLSRVAPDPAALDTLPPDVCQEHGILPRGYYMLFLTNNQTVATQGVPSVAHWVKVD